MLPCGVRQASHASYFAPIYHFLLRKKKKMNAPAGNQTRVSSVAGTYTITVLPALILMSAQLVSTQSDNLVILQDSQCRNAMSAEAMAQWQRVGFQTQRLGVRIPLASHLFLFFCRVTDDDTLKTKTNCRNWESHPGCRGHNAESCY